MPSDEWRGWLRVRRLVPLTTMAIGIGAGIANLLGRCSPQVIQDVIVAMLSLIAFDAIIERVQIMDKIDRRLAKLDAPAILRDRSEMIPLERLAYGGDDIAACGISLISLIGPHRDYLASRIDKGAKFRLIVLDQASNAWKAWHEAQQIPNPEDVAITLRTLEPLVRCGKGIEVRLAPWHLPVSLVIVDGKRETGRMNVEVAFTALSLPRRPHMYLNRSADPEWFDFFLERFDYLWSISKVWTPPPLANGGS